MKKLLVLFCLILISFSDASSQQRLSDTSQKTEFTLLFVGNSLTYTHNLPKLVKKQAKKKGIEIEYKMIALPNYALEDHWKDGNVQKLIAKENYDFVIMQQGPSSQIDGRNMLIEYGKKIDSICRLNNTRLCYFMVWPSLQNYHTFDGVIKNHQDAASINNALLLPVGQAWKDHFDETNDFQYYGPDWFHPSITGSKVAAKVIADYLFAEIEK